ncbi:MAG: F0F1 ATP synthase subunit B [Planctomycetes bacterium]|nr:F0F1 ATP synthase subunit B [Planctomycetota bacterium]
MSVTLASIVTLASEGASPELIKVDSLPAITAVVVFLVAFTVLATVVWPKITKGLDERNEKILSEIRAAEAAQAKAKAAQAEFEKRLEEARAEADRTVRAARAEAERQAEELRARAAKELEDMKNRATQELEGAKRAALSEIHAMAAGLATTVAGKILKREIQAGDQRRLVEESLSELSAR